MNMPCLYGNTGSKPSSAIDKQCYYCETCRLKVMAQYMQTIIILMTYYGMEQNVQETVSAMMTLPMVICLLLFKMWNAFTLSQEFSIEILQAFKLCMNHLPSYGKILCPWIYHSQLYTSATCIKCIMVIQPSQVYLLYSARLKGINIL